MLIIFEILWAQVLINLKSYNKILLFTWTILVHILRDVDWNTNGKTIVHNSLKLVLNLGITMTFYKHTVFCFVYF